MHEVTHLITAEVIEDKKFIATPNSPVKTSACVCKVHLYSIHLVDPSLKVFPNRIRLQPQHSFLILKASFIPENERQSVQTCVSDQL